MSIWAGLGFNYGHQAASGGPAYYDLSTSGQVAQDFALLKSWGVRWIRTALVAYNSNMASGTDATQQLALFAKSYGFNVLWGVTGLGTVRTNQTSYAGSFVDGTNAPIRIISQWAQANGIDALTLGNENENQNAQTVGTLTQGGGTATVTTAGNHGYVSGATVTIAGATPGGYNGAFTITKTGSNTFTYACSSSLSSPATGTITCRDMTNAQMISYITAAGTTAAQYFTNGPVSYNSLSMALADWLTSPAANNGLGGLSQIGFNLYDSGSTLTAELNSIVAKWSSNAYVSEWSTFDGINPYNGDEQRWAVLIRNLRITLQTAGVARAFYFCFRDGGYGVNANWWSIMQTNNTLRLAAAVLVGERLWYVGQSNASLPPRMSTPFRAHAPPRAGTVARGTI